MHWIQKHILRELSTHASRRYIELKPASIDGNLFMYHMQQLQKSGYISKQDRAYTLSGSGKTFASRMSLRQGTPLVQPKIVVMLICQNAQGQYLLFRWRRQPYFGLVSFPFSKLHFGRTLKETLEEALFYKTQLSGDFTFAGNIYLRVAGSKGEITEHTLIHVYKIMHPSGTLGGYDGLTGEPFWGMPQDVPHSEHVPGFADIFAAVTTKEQGYMQEITVSQL